MYISMYASGTRYLVLTVQANSGDCKLIVFSSCFEDGGSVVRDAFARGQHRWIIRIWHRGERFTTASPEAAENMRDRMRAWRRTPRCIRL